MMHFTAVEWEKARMADKKDCGTIASVKIL